jgi:hypothetical protein
MPADPRKLLLTVEKLTVVEFNNLVSLVQLHKVPKLVEMKRQAFEAGNDAAVEFMSLAIQYRRYLDEQKKNGCNPS